MFYLKSSRVRKPVRKQLLISSFEGINLSLTESILPYKYSPLSYNFYFGDGALSTGMGFNQAKLPHVFSAEYYHLAPPAPYDIKDLWLYRRYDHINETRDDRIVILTVNGSLYETKLFVSDTFHLIEGIEIEGASCAVNYRLNGEDVFIISSGAGLWVYDGTSSPVKAEGAPLISSMCVHYERLYATTGGEKNSIWFSDDFNPLNWNVSMTEGGFIELHDELGRANKVISFLDHIYVFRDYGINRLTAYGNQSEFNMSRLYTTSGRINPDTVAVCGDRVIFYADDGLYVFDGASTRRILDNISPLLVSGKYNKACYYNGRYYLAARANFKDNIKVLTESHTLFRNNVLIELDMAKGAVNLMRGADIVSLLPVNVETSSFLLASFRRERTTSIGMLDMSGAFFGAPLDKYWRTPLSDFNLKGKKHLREFQIYTSEDIEVEIIADAVSHRYYLRGGTCSVRLKLNLNAEKFTIAIESSSSNAFIHSPSIIIDF